MVGLFGLGVKGLYGEAVRNSAIANGVELLAGGKPFVIGLNSRGSHDSEGTKTKEYHHQAEGSDVHSFEMQTFVTPCEGEAMREKLP